MTNTAKSMLISGANESATPKLEVTTPRFEHHPSIHHLGTHETRPRLSWKILHAPDGFIQQRYAIELHDDPSCLASRPLAQLTVESRESVLVPWPSDKPLCSRQRIFTRVKVWGTDGLESPWSEPASIEAGLLQRDDWRAQRIASPWQYPKETPQPEELYRALFQINSKQQIRRARLYITSQGVYEAEINGRVVGDHFLAPGWTVYDKRLQYQTFDVLEHLSNASENHVIGVRVAEGWFCGRLSFGGGFRNIWGDRPALLAQLEIDFADGTSQVLVTDSSWSVSKGPTVLAEIYNGEKYDARLEIPGWSSDPDLPVESTESWQKVQVLENLPASTHLCAQESQPVRRTEVVQPVTRITSPSGKTIFDFGQNLVGYTRVKSFQGREGQQIVLSHAEVLEHGELGRRPLRFADNVDIYTAKGDNAGESWEPRFTFHGFRYLQVDGWTESATQPLLSSVEAVVCHTDMERIGHFDCSNDLVNKLHNNVVWSMRGNFLSVPTDCPQRDERMGWTGDLAVFSPSAGLLYDCTAMLKGWLEDVFAEQSKHGGIAPLVVPNTLERSPMFGRVMPAAIWSDVTVLAPWALYDATGDSGILESQYQSMVDWISAIPRNEVGNTHLWKDGLPQLGDWLDPAAPPDNPGMARTDSVLVANAYLIRVLGLMSRIASIINRPDDAAKYQNDFVAAKQEFVSEYMSLNGRIMSDSQTSYALAIVFDLIPSATQKQRASDRIADIVRRNAFKIGTGFAGTPHICEALVQAGHAQVAYSMLVNEQCPSWLYPVTMGSTTIWERWDSMLADGSINPGEMTSFNHYALGAVIKFLWERLAGLQCAEPGWKRIKVAPIIGGRFTHAAARLETPYGETSSDWAIVEDSVAKTHTFTLKVVIPPNTTGEVSFPTECGEHKPVSLRSGRHTFTIPCTPPTDWPVKPISMFG